MEKLHWLVKWATQDGCDDYEIVLATTIEINAIEDRLQGAGFTGVDANPVVKMEYDAEEFNQYLDEIEIPR